MTRRDLPPLLIAAALLFTGVWWGWPGSFDQHDPTTKAWRMWWERSADPGIRYWGAFGYQEVLLFSVLPAAALKRIPGFEQETALALSYLFTRILWAVKALAVVALSGFATRALFDDARAGRFAMWLLALAPGYIAWAHTPQVDMAHAFWYAVAVAAAVRGWWRQDLRWLYGAALAAGLAAGVKYVGGIVVVAPMLAALYLRGIGGLLHAVLLGTLALGIFALTTPLATGDPLAWLAGYLADVLANQHREIEAPLAFFTMPRAMADLVGPAFAALGVLSLLALLIPGASRGRSQAWGLLIAAIVPYYLSLSWQHVATVRYVMPLALPIAVLLGFAASRALSTGMAPVLVRIAGTTALAAQFALSAAFVTGLVTDTRVRLRDWLVAHADAGAVVETTLNHRPYFTGGAPFRELSRPHFQAETAEMAERIARDHDSGVRRLFDAVMTRAGLDPLRVRTWVDRERSWLEKSAATFNPDLVGPRARGSDWLAINLNTARFYVIDWPGHDPVAPREREFFTAVLDGDAAYPRVELFQPLVPDWLQYPREIWFNVSPPIALYAVRSP